MTPNNQSEEPEKKGNDKEETPTNKGLPALLNPSAPAGDVGDLLAILWDHVRTQDEYLAILQERQGATPDPHAGIVQALERHKVAIEDHYSRIKDLEKENSDLRATLDALTSKPAKQTKG